MGIGCWGALKAPSAQTRAQVTIAVLLDNFLTASEEMKAEEHRRLVRERQAQKQLRHAHRAHVFIIYGAMI